MLSTSTMSILDADSSDRSSNPYSSYKKGKTKSVILPLIGVVLLIVLTAGGVIYLAKVKPEVLGLAKNIQAENKKDLDNTVKMVGKLMLLPTETPTLATVNDLNKVRGQDFFKNAAVGDKVLVYTGAKKAILYRPSNNKIIEVGVVNIPSGSAQGPTLTPSAPANQSQVSGATNEIPFIPTATPQIPTVTPVPTVALPSATPTPVI